MHGLVLLDARSEVLRPAILWNDQRTAGAVRRDRPSASAGRASSSSPATPRSTGFTAPKILWVRDHEPEVYAQARHVAAAEGLRPLPTDRRVRHGQADGAGHAPLRRQEPRAGRSELLEPLEIHGRLAAPDVFEWPESTGDGHGRGRRRDRSGRRNSGRRRRRRSGGWRVSATGASGPASSRSTIGTSGVVFADDRRTAQSSPRDACTPSATPCPGSWHVMGVMLSAAGSLRWFRDTPRRRRPSSGDDSSPTAEAARRPGSEGLLFLPYLTGERTPHLDPHARGVFVGLTAAPQTGAPHPRGPRGRRLRAAGLLRPAAGRGPGRGAARSASPAAARRAPLWRQILANVLGLPMVTVNSTEGAAYGAALLAGVGRRRVAERRGRLRRDDRGHRPRRAGGRVDEGLRRLSTRATASCTPRSSRRTTRCHADRPAAAGAQEQQLRTMRPPEKASRALRSERMNQPCR